MRVVKSDNEPIYTDADLIRILKETNDSIGILYKRHKNYCINFMKGKYKDHEEIKDIYHDAVMVFYEKIKTPGFELTCSIQTYLNTICRNQILKRINHSNRYKVSELEENNDNLCKITDTLEELEGLNDERISVMKRVLLDMKENSSKCYELFIRFWFKNQAMDEIAKAMMFANADSAKNQKARCQKNFKIEVTKILTK